MSTLRRGFTLDDQRDADILARLDAEENLSAVIREALRRYYGQTLTLDDIMHAIQGLTLSTASTPSTAEEPDLSAALQNLGL